MRATSIWGLYVLCLVAAGCGLPAELAEDGTGAPPNLVAKSDLEGEWLWATTVVEVVSGRGVTFVGETSGELLCVRFDIQEDTLYARLAYERVTGLDGASMATGTLVGAWAVQHVDHGSERQRAWHEREHLLVDWSENLATGGQLLWPREVTVEPLGSATDPDDPRSPRLARDTDGEAQYLEATARLLVTPQEGDDGLLDCYLAGNTTDCTASEVVVRHAFLRRDPVREYSPRPTTAEERTEMGVAEILRRGDDGDVQRLAKRLNLYGAWFRPATDEITAEALAGGRPFDCPGDPAPCRYTDDDSPLWLRGRPAQTDAEVPAAIRDSTDATDLYYCRQEFEPDAEDCFFVHNGATVYTEDASSTTPLPLRPAQRPLAPVAYHLAPGFPPELLPALRRALDQWNEVLLQTAWLHAGCPVADFATRDQQPCAGRPELGDPEFRLLVLCESNPVQAGDPPECGPEGTEARLGDLRYHHLVWVEPPLQQTPLGFGPALADPLTGEVRSANVYVFADALDRQARLSTEWVGMQTNQNYEWERALWGSATIAPPPSPRGAGAASGARRPPLDLNILRRLNRIRARHHKRSVLYPSDAPLNLNGREAEIVCALCCDESERENGLCTGDLENCVETPSELTARWADNPGCRDRVELRVRELLLQQAVLHELGHNLGLRHNFKGSYDALNYGDSYWEWRKADGTVGPRTSDPETAVERRHIRRHETSSIMDFGGLWGADDVALGRWDRAATHHSYAGFAQVFNEINNADLIAWVEEYRDSHAPFPILLWIGAPPEVMQYTRLHYDPSLTDTQDNAVDTSGENRHWVPAVWITPQQLTTSSDVRRTDQLVEELAGTARSRVRVSYQFCTDELRDQIPGCEGHDRGADAFEITQNTITAYHGDHWFNNWSWDRDPWRWNTDTYESLLWERYFAPLRRTVAYWLLWHQLLTDSGQYTPAQLEQAIGMGTWRVAVNRAFETLTQPLIMAEEGYHIPDGHSGGLTPVQGSYCSPPEDCVYVSHLYGRDLDSLYDAELAAEGVQKLVFQGHRADRLLALAALTEPMTATPPPAFGSSDPEATYHLADIFGDHLAIFIAALVSLDTQPLAPSFCGLDGNGTTIEELRDITQLHKPRCSMTGGTFQGFFDPRWDAQQRDLAATLWMEHLPSVNRRFFDLAAVYSISDRYRIDATDLPPEAEFVEFLDPLSYRRYLAVRYPDVNMARDPVHDPPDYYSVSIGARMLDHANDLATEFTYWYSEWELDPTQANYDEMLYYRTALDEYMARVEVMRDLTAEHF